MLPYIYFADVVVQDEMFTYPYVERINFNILLFHPVFVKAVLYNM